MPTVAVATPRVIGHGLRLDASPNVLPGRASRAACAALFTMLVASFGWLALVYLQAPPDMPQPPRWSPRQGHTAEVSALYRTALGLPAVGITAGHFAGAHQVGLVATLASAGALIAFFGARLSRRAVWVGGFMLAAVAVVMPPLYTTDVFYYGLTGEAVARLGGNPHVDLPSAFEDSRFAPFNYWDIPTPYGPVWTTVSAGVAWLGGYDPFRVTILFKVLGAAAVLGTARMLARSLGPSGSSIPLALLLLNPVVWLEAVANAHPDALMLFLMAGAVAPLAAGHSRQAWAWLVLAGLVKYLTAPALALHVVARLRREGGGYTARGRILGLLIVDALALACLLWLPYWQGAATLASTVAEAGRTLPGPLPQIALAVGGWLGASEAELGLLVFRVVVVGAVAWLIAWSCLLLWLWRRPGGPSLDDELLTWGVVLLTLPLATPFSHPWYLLVPIGLLLFCWRRAPRLVLAGHAIIALWVLLRYFAM